MGPTKREVRKIIDSKVPNGKRIYDRSLEGTSPPRDVKDSGALTGRKL